MTYTPTLEDTEEVVRQSYTPTLEDTEEVLPQLKQTVMSASPAINNLPAKHKRTLEDMLAGISKGLSAEYQAKGALGGGAISGASQLASDIGARLLSEKSEKDPLSATIDNFLSTHSSEYAPLTETGKVIGSNAPLFALPGGAGARLAEKLLPAALNRGITGTVLRGAAQGATGNAIAEPLLNPDEDLSQAIQHGAETGGLLGSTLPLVAKGLPGVVSRLGYSVSATPEGTKKIATDLYDAAIHAPEREGAKISTNNVRAELQEKLKQYQNKTSPTSDLIKAELQKRLNDLPRSLSPSDAHQWVKDLRSQGNEAFKNYPETELGKFLNSASNAMAEDVISGIEKPRIKNSEVVYKGNPEAANNYRAANTYFANRAAPARENPVSKLGLGAQGLVTAFAPEITGHEGLLGRASALVAPKFLHLENPAENVAKRFLGDAGRREMSQSFNKNDPLARAIAQMIPAILNYQSGGK